MASGKGKRQVSFLLDEGLMDRVEKWRESQVAPPSKTAVHEAALREFLEHREGKKKKPG